MRKAGLSSEEIARKAFQLRRDIQIKYRSLTPKKTLEKIYARNLAKYGDKDGPTIDWLRSQGKSWDEITDSASRSGGNDLKL